MRMKCVQCGEYGRRKPKKETNLTWEVTSDVSIDFKPKEPPFFCAICKSKPPPADFNCMGTNAIGNQCGHWQKHHSLYCAHHQNQGESK